MHRVLCYLAGDHLHDVGCVITSLALSSRLPASGFCCLYGVGSCQLCGTLCAAYCSHSRETASCELCVLCVHVCPEPYLPSRISEAFAKSSSLRCVNSACWLSAFFRGAGSDGHCLEIVGHLILRRLMQAHLPPSGLGYINSAGEC